MSEWCASQSFGHREAEAASRLCKALRAGPQSDPGVEARRQWWIGYAAGVLGLVRFQAVSQACQRM